MQISSVLVVEDSEGDQFLAKMAIEEYDQNITILQAYDGLEALNILKDLGKQPDLILLDINMPRMDGLEFLEAYNKCEEVSSSPVVVMLTSSVLATDKDKSETYNFVKGYIEKPLELLHLEELYN